MTSTPTSPAADAATVQHLFDEPPAGYEGFIFDCDGTLADSMPLHFAAWRAAFSAAGAPFTFSWDLFMRRAGKTLEITVAELNQEFSTQLDVDAVAAAQRKSYEELLPQVGPVASVVAFARERLGRHPMAVASGGDRVTVRRTLTSLGILPWFGAVVTAEDVVHGKPAPDLFLLAAERIAVPPQKCLVFEDSLLGIEAAHRAEMGAVLVRRSGTLPG